MDEDERPRKLQKLDLDSSKDASEGLNPYGESSMSDVAIAISSPPPPEASRATESPAAEDENEADSANGEQAGSYENGNSLIAQPDQEGQRISKKQLKRLRKAQKWEEERPLRKAIRKEKQAEKRKRLRLEKLDAQGQEQHNGEGERPTTPHGSTPRNPPVLVPEVGRRLKTAHPIPTPITFILDCGFDEYMIDKEIISLGAQLTRCYAEHRRSPYRAQVVVSSFGSGKVDRLKDRFDTTLAKAYLGWKGTRFVPDDFVAAAQDARKTMTSRRWRLQGPLARYDGDASEGVTLGTTAAISPAPGTEKGRENRDEEATKHAPEAMAEETMLNDEPATTEGTKAKASIADENIIYLSSESPNMLTHLSPNAVYIIGGIVDRNRHKGICYKRACDRGIRTAKLPIGEYLDMKSRFVLATNHVLEIMLKWLDCGDWAVAFEQVVPKRKGGVLKTKVKDGTARLGADAEGELDSSEDEIERVEVVGEDPFPERRDNALSITESSNEIVEGPSIT